MYQIIYWLPVPLPMAIASSQKVTNKEISRPIFWYSEEQCECCYLCLISLGCRDTKMGLFFLLEWPKPWLHSEDKILLLGQISILENCSRENKHSPLNQLSQILWEWHEDIRRFWRKNRSCEKPFCPQIETRQCEETDLNQCWTMAVVRSLGDEKPSLLHGCGLLKSHAHFHGNLRVYLGWCLGAQLQGKLYIKHWVWLYFYLGTWVGNRTRKI